MSDQLGLLLAVVPRLVAAMHIIGHALTCCSLTRATMAFRALHAVLCYAVQVLRGHHVIRSCIVRSATHSSPPPLPMRMDSSTSA